MCVIIIIIYISISIDIDIYDYDASLSVPFSFVLDRWSVPGTLENRFTCDKEYHNHYDSKQMKGK